MSLPKSDINMITQMRVYLNMLNLEIEPERVGFIDDLREWITEVERLQAEKQLYYEKLDTTIGENYHLGEDKYRLEQEVKRLQGESK